MRVTKLLPMRLRGLLRSIRARLRGVDTKYIGMTTEEIFEEVYRLGAWGRDPLGRPISGSGSHKANLIEPYISRVRDFLMSIECSVIVDLGCGDFNVGSRFVDLCENYIACDISGYVIKANMENFDYSNVSFRRLNIVDDDLPPGDIAVVRQVLQHLRNEDVGRFVEKLHSRKPFKYLIVTEHLPAGSFQSNFDKPSGPSIRAELGSGIVLHDEPFNLESKERSVLVEVEDWTFGFKSMIRSTVYKF